MNEPDENPVLYSFVCESIEVPPGTPAGLRPADRPRNPYPDAPFAEPQFYSFDCTMEELPPGTMAAPRPPDRPRVPDSDAVFARELADRVLEYTRGRTDGATAEELAALVQSLVAKRSA